MLHTKGTVFKRGIGPSFLLAVYAIANVDPFGHRRTGERPIEDGPPLFLPLLIARDCLKFVNEIKKG